MFEEQDGGAEFLGEVCEEGLEAEKRGAGDGGARPGAKRREAEPNPELV